MRTIALLALLALLCVSGTLAASVCSGTVCATETNTLQDQNNVKYCCPSTHVAPSASNYADPSTYSCPTTQDCSQCTRNTAQGSAWMQD